MGGAGGDMEDRMETVRGLAGKIKEQENEDYINNRRKDKRKILAARERPAVDPGTGGTSAGSHCDSG